MSKNDPSLFIFATGNIKAYFLVYVDDLLLTGNNNDFLHGFISALSSRFALKNLGAPHYFLGVEFIPIKSGLFLSQHKYIRDILEKFDMEGAKPAPTPLSPSATLQLHDGIATTEATYFRKIIGAVQYLTLTRPDLSFSINKLSQFMHKLTTLHLQHLKRLLYIKHTINYGISLQPSSSFHLLAYTDADWGGNFDDRTSTSAYIIFFGGNPVSWLSKKQRTVARSSTEAEYRAVATATTELMWLTNLLTELNVPIGRPPLLLCDNVGATYLCSNPVLHSRIKHISLDYHFVREQVQAGKMFISHVSTKDQLADLLTKPLATT
uniref:Copia protein n=1 Tax=Cajanus cajan TaxID=3821 RepID=A0A151TFL1_CAJCA|nr:Copia protein [Cajanus cajan]